MLVERLLGPESSDRIRSRPAHAINPPHVRGQRGSHRRVNAIIHPIFEACCLHNPGEPSKVQVTHRREEVVLDLIIQASDIPAEDAVARSEVRRRFNLVYCPLSTRPHRRPSKTGNTAPSTPWAS